MEFDFYEQFKTCSNTELLAIVKQSASYQPSAIEAAKRLIVEREISAEEFGSVEQYYLQIEKNEQLKKDRVEALKYKVADFLEPITKPGREIEAGKWANFLLIAIGIDFCWNFFNLIKYLIGLFSCNHCQFDIYSLTQILPIFYLPVIFYLVLTKHRWGWILVFANFLSAVIMNLSQPFLLSEYFRFDGYYYLLIILEIVLLIFLWRKSICEYFQIDLEAKKKTVYFTSGATILFILFLELFV